MFSNCESLKLIGCKQNLKMETEPETAKFNVLNVSQSFFKNSDSLLSLLKNCDQIIKKLKILQS